VVFPCFPPVALLLFSLWIIVLFFVFLQGGNNEKRMSGDLVAFKDQFLAVNKLKNLQRSFSVLSCFPCCSSPAFLSVNYFVILFFYREETMRRERGLISTAVLRKIDNLRINYEYAVLFFNAIIFF
jgi:hypothetical protein